MITGKYLNNIHNFLVNDNFYRLLYKRILDKYLEITNYQTLKTISVDSQFIRNVAGENCEKNPHYYNKRFAGRKPGLKVHSLVDSERVAISICDSPSTVNDSVVIKDLFDSNFVDDQIFKDHAKVLLADTAYSGLLNINDITSQGIGIIMGKNKSHIKGNINLVENAC